MRPETCIRVSEWSSVPVEGRLTVEQREGIEAAARVWQTANGLSASPLSFSGANGDRLGSRQYVGVVEVAGVAVEIYPKLDREIIGDREITSEELAGTAMRNLLWMMEVSGSEDISPTDAAHLEEQSMSFYDVFAYLLAKNLRDELATGVPHAYQTQRDTIPAVRGRIDILQQVTRQWNRLDRIACIWDEFTPDTPLNRLFRCACQMLHGRVGNPAAARLLADCLVYLDSVSPVDAGTALREVRYLRWDRFSRRLKTSFDMAVRLLAGSGYDTGSGQAETFVFLIDMNKLFEDYVAVALEAAFQTEIRTQEGIGNLFRKPSCLSQRPDYLWVSGGQRWIGDAKYKHLAAGQEHALRFEESLPDDDDDDTPVGTSATRVLSTNDVRQVTTYAELLRIGHESPPSDVAILYPFVGSGRFEGATGEAWNGSRFHLIPVRVAGCQEAIDVLPSDVCAADGAGPSYSPNQSLTTNCAALLSSRE